MVRVVLGLSISGKDKKTRLLECVNLPSSKLDNFLIDPTTLLNFQCCIWKYRYLYREGNYKLATFERLLIHSFTLSPEFCQPFVISTFFFCLHSSSELVFLEVHGHSYIHWHIQVTLSRKASSSSIQKSSHIHCFSYYLLLFLFATPFFKSRSGNELPWQVYIVFPVSSGQYCDSTTN
jgi:hypothetical protein